MRQAISRIAIAALVLCIAFPASAGAATVAELKKELEAVKKKTQRAGAAYEKAYWELDETEVALERTEKDIAETETKLVEAQNRLGGRVSGIYRRQNLDVISFLVGSGSFEELVTRADYLARIGDADAEVVAEVKSLRRDLLEDQKRLSAEQKKRAQRTKELRAQRDKLQKELKGVQAEFDQVKSRLAAARAKERGVSSTSYRAVAGSNGLVFPVRGSYYYSNTWGASRSGGRRRHQGTDIMSPHGTPCVAVTSGTVSSKTGGLGGRVIWLRGDNGVSYYYAHLSSWAVRSGRVSAGQVIGYVGSTGNASANAPHLHFEIHPGGGGAVNPYPHLRAME